jgi:hypothetical protein
MRWAGKNEVLESDRPNRWRGSNLGYHPSPSANPWNLDYTRLGTMRGGGRQIRVLNALPSVTMRSVAIGFGPETNTTGFGALLGLKPQPGDLITTQQRRLGLTQLTGAAETHVYVHITAMDSKSILDHAHPIAEAVRVALGNGHELGSKIQRVARPI